LTTAGSGFDTVVAVYTGTSLGNLQFVAGDDDGVPPLESLVSFNAAAGTTYFIQFDGYKGVMGNIKLAWHLEETPIQTPVITIQPVSQTVPVGSNVTLSVVVEPGPQVVYQ